MPFGCDSLSGFDARRDGEEYTQESRVRVTPGRRPSATGSRRAEYCVSQAVFGRIDPRDHAVRQIPDGMRVAILFAAVCKDRY